MDFPLSHERLKVRSRRSHGNPPHMENKIAATEIVGGLERLTGQFECPFTFATPVGSKLVAVRCVDEHFDW